MPEFDGSIRLEDGDGDALDTKLTVDSGRLVVTAGEHEIGDWAIEDLSVERRNGDFFVRVEGEELVLGVSDPVGFHQGLGLDDRPSKKRRMRKPKKVRESLRKSRSEVDPVSSVPTPADRTSGGEWQAVAAQGDSNEPTLWSRIPRRWKVAGAGVIALTVLGILAPSWLALLLLLVGMLTLFLGIAARNDSGTKVLPPPFFATTAAAVGGIVLVLLAVAIISLT